jgi:hypothetical protein
MDDLPIKKEEEDIMDFANNAKQFAEEIMKLPVSEHSFSIGVIGKWGSGKTSYLNLTKEVLEKQEEQTIIINFNPRNSQSKNNIQSDFFELLFSKLKQYDLRCSFSFQKYLKAIGIHIDNKFFSILLNLQGILDKDTEREKIENAIKRLSKRIVIFIEDFDRLFKSEILEVFKLIDSNASFSNVIFIMAYDKEQLNRLLKYDNFSEKFVTWEHTLPVRPYDKRLMYFQEELFKGIGISGNNRIGYEAILQNHKEILEANLSTIRDIKRFLNMFISPYNQVKQDVEFQDYLLLTIIKYKNYNEYMKLRDKEFIEKDNIFYCIKEGAVKGKKSKKIISYLFPERNQVGDINFGNINDKSILSVTRTGAFNTYFYNFVVDGIPMIDMDKLFEPNSDFGDMEKWEKDNKLNYFIDYVDSKNILNFDDKITFERFIDILLHLNYKYNFREPPLEKIRQIIMINHFNEILNRCNYNNENDCKQMISQKLEGIYPDYPFDIVRRLLVNSIRNDDISYKDNFPDERLCKSIFSKNELLQIAKNSLSNLIQNDNIVKQVHMDLLYCCIDSINTSEEFLLDKTSCKEIYELIKSNPVGYFEKFVRLGEQSSRADLNSITCEPFWKQIFGGIEKFEQFLEAYKDNIQKFELIDNFWALYKNNEYKMIVFEGQGNVQEKIENKLREERKELIQLLQIQEELNNTEKNDVTKYQELKNKLASIHLKIQLGNALRKAINNKLQNNGQHI